jgi:Tol biopolymer transport system component
MSQLGFAEIQTPVWRPDSGALAFIAAQSDNAPMGIYIVELNTGNQRRVLELPTRELRDLAWDGTGSRLFFSNQTLFVLNVESGALSGSLTEFTGFGPDFSPVHNPNGPELYYLKMMGNLNTGQRGGILSFFATDEITEPMVERRGAELYASSLEYSRDGAYLLIASDKGIWVQDQSIQTASEIIRDMPVPPRPALSPDGEQVAFIGLDERAVEQIYVMDRRGGPVTQLTFHQDGTITDLVWVAG